VAHPSSRARGGRSRRPGASAASSPQSTNAGAEQSALSAYRTYLSALNAAGSSAAARDEQVVVGVASTCANALADLSELSTGQLNTTALTAFGNEVDADLDLAYVSAGAKPLTRFATALSGLTWSTPAEYSTTMQLISGERALLDLSQPHLCVDAIALDGAPLSEPTSTRRFLSRYARASTALNTDLAAFQSLLAKFETKSESRIVVQINALVSGYSSIATANEQTAAGSVLSDLGVSS
jgi:hypothetical protein